MPADRAAARRAGRLTDSLRRTAVAGLAAVAMATAACGSSTGASGATGASGPVTLRLGYLANLTHAPALVGTSKGYLQSALGSSVTLKTQVFNAGPQETEALLAGSLDAAYLGPNSAVNGFVTSHGAAIRVVSGATSGGAALVVRPGISAANDLRGRKLATPQLGNTQDVALRAWLLDSGLHTSVQGGGDVTIAPTDNATALTLFKQGSIDGAWVPEPWASRMVDEGHGTVLVQEASLWPGGAFPTTELAVSTDFLSAHPDTVEALVAGNQRTIAWMNANRAAAATAANSALATITGKALAAPVLNDAWSHLAFTVDPLLVQLKKQAADAVRVGTVRSAQDLRGIWDGRSLSAVLQAAGLPAVNDAGLAA